MNKIKETKKNSDFAGKERERRRRKMMVDQTTAQSKLDSHKSEAALIAKLLEQTSQEQTQAYMDRRTANCKVMLFEQRRSKADQLESEREEQREQAEVVRARGAQDLEKQRNKKNAALKITLNKQHRESKAIKRSLNIEIASGLVDLILDLSEETFEVMNSHPENQIAKPEWFQFLGLFNAGKKVSIRNIKAAPVVEDQGSSQRLDIAKNAQAFEVLREYLEEPSLRKMYEYLC